MSMPSNNPILDWETHPDFSAITPDHVLPAMRAALSVSLQELKALEEAPPRTWHGLLVPLERLSDRVFRAWGLVSHLHNVMNSPALRAVHAQMQPEVIAFANRLGQSRPIFEALRALRFGDDFPGYSRALQRTILVLLRDAELKGVGLDGDQRARFNQISQELAELGTRFTNNVLDSTQAFALTLRDRSEVDGLPEESRRLAAAMSVARGNPEATAENGPWTITLDAPSYLSFMHHANRRDLRETVYKAYVTRASHGAPNNLPLIRRILVLRRELAALLGFEHFAAMSLVRKMAPSVASIEGLLDRIRDAATDYALNDLIELGELARSRGQAEDIQPWDVLFWAERLKEERFGLHDEQVRPFFPLPAILGGLFALARDVFGVVIEPAEQPVWRPDVRYFEVLDADKQAVAGFYLDPYARPEEKRGGAWMDELTSSSVACAPAGQDRRRPIAYINCNQRPPLDDAPSLMSFQEVTTLFHEFGHALQHMLTTVKHGFVAGINHVDWDAVELPSQFMENWCYQREILASLARHYQTGESMPESMLDTLLGARTFRAGSSALRQIALAKTDLALHTAPDPESLDPIEIDHDIARQIQPLPPVPEDRFLCSFAHIFDGGYAAGYYSYKWAEVLSADAFSAFTEAGIENESARRFWGRRFRDTVLSLGGSRPPMEIFRLFRGREPDPTALLRQEGLLAPDKDA